MFSETEEFRAVYHCIRIAVYHNRAWIWLSWKKTERTCKRVWVSFKITNPPLKKPQKKINVRKIDQLVSRYFTIHILDILYWDDLISANFYNNAIVSEKIDQIKIKCVNLANIKYTNVFTRQKNFLSWILYMI